MSGKTIVDVFRRYPVLERGIVHLKGTGRAFHAVVWRRRGGYLVLRDVELLERRAEPIHLDGEVAVLERDVEFIQVVG